ncbi:MAG: GNAT family N-acetyltransferase, partial [Salibacteraceae bacterium]|nr:GNAT family N-acetyltransferase [Salibacteraceae bacterium]
AIEAAQFFKELGFYFTEVPSIISLIHPENKPSQAVAMRNGMKPDGKAVHKDEEAVIYRILRPKI